MATSILANERAAHLAAGGVGVVRTNVRASRMQF